MGSRSDSPIASSRVHNGSKLQKFDRDDACYLKSNPKLIGHISRTHYDVDGHDPLSEVLILKYTEVPENDLMAFMTTGVPPKEYVFVNFVEPSHGNALIHENDLELLDRVLELGENVKRHPDDTTSGTVISASATCTLEPIAFRTVDPITGDYSSLKFTEKPINLGSNHSLVVENENISPPLIHDVPLSELTKHEEFSEGDYIIYRHKIGVIQEIERDPIILLPNRKAVSPLEPFALEIPLCSSSKSIVSLPETDSLRSHALWNDEFAWTSETEFLFPGQATITSASNIHRADLGPEIIGSIVQCHVIATPPMDIHVDWLCPNVFAAGSPSSGPNSEVLRASTLQGSAVKCDFKRTPCETPGSQPVSCSSLPEIGERVRFCDPHSVAAKYPPYQHIPPEQSFGHDVNIFRIVASKTRVTVQWQDGSITHEEATSLHKFSGAEDEVWPGNIVVLKDSVERTGVLPESIPTPHSSIRSMERDVLRLPQVGIVQTVDGRERIASVRWYENPDVQMLFGGGVLKPRSSLGKLGNTVTDVSVYELTTYSGLSKFPNDLVIICPQSVHASALPPSPPPELTTPVGPCQLSWLSPASFQDLFFYLWNIKMAMINTEWFKNTTTIINSNIPRRYSIHNNSSSVRSPVDFFGKIVSMDVNGIITVRLSSATSSRDIHVPLERILMVVDLNDSVPPMPLQEIGLLGALNPSFRLQNLSVPMIFRYASDSLLLDNNGSDDGDEWMTDEESDGVDADEIDEGADSLTEPPLADSVAEVTEITPSEAFSIEQGGQTHIDSPINPVAPGDNLPPILSFPIPSICPPSFCILESSPPPDHRYIDKTLPDSSSGIRMKRIRKEFQILESALPPGIFVRTWESRMDLIRVMILGPEGTPYEHAPFLIDAHFPQDFPDRPPSAFFHSWTDGQGMVNPNLYEEGKICLSILGTWPTENPNETWSPSQSTVLQILVSIMGLVLVKAPFYNEAGYEALAAEDNRRIESSQYTEKAFLLTRRFIKHALDHPIPGFEDVLAWHYLPDATATRPQLLRRAINEALGMIEHHNCTSSEHINQIPSASPFFSRLSLGAVVMLRKHISTLEKLEADVSFPRST